MEKNMEHEMETEVIWGFKECNLSYYKREIISYSLVYVPSILTWFKFLNPNAYTYIYIYIQYYPPSATVR